MIGAYVSIQRFIPSPLEWNITELDIVKNTRRDVRRLQLDWKSLKPHALGISYFHATPTTPRKGRRDCRVSKPFNSVLWPVHGHWQLLLGKLALFSLLQCLAVVTAALASYWDLETGSWADLSNLTEKYKSNQRTALGCIGVSRSERTLWQCSVTMVQLWAHGSLAPRTFCLKE